MSKLKVVFIIFSFLWFFNCSNSTDPDADPIVVSAELTHISSLGNSDGAIDLTCSGGKPPYSFAWNTGASTEDISGLRAGWHSVMVTDAENAKSEKSFTLTQPDTGTVTDIDGNVYKTIRIGTQIWMSENLRVTHDPQGNPLTDYSPPNNDSTNIEKYGLLYSWFTVMQGPVTPGVGPQGIAPDGWHIPTSDEFTILINFLGGETVAGGKMKEAGTSNWNHQNTDATNSSKFSALPAGRNSINNFFGEETWFTTVETNVRLSSSSSYCTQNNITLFSYWHSVRCIKN